MTAPFESSTKDQRFVTCFLSSENYSYSLLNEVALRWCLPVTPTSVFERTRRFQNGKKSARDSPRLVRAYQVVTAEPIAAVEDIIMKNGRMMMDETAALSCTHGSHRNRLTDFWSNQERNGKLFAVWWRSTTGDAWVTLHATNFFFLFVQEFLHLLRARRPTLSRIGTTLKNNTHLYRFCLINLEQKSVLGCHLTHPHMFGHSAWKGSFFPSQLSCGFWKDGSN